MHYGFCTMLIDEKVDFSILVTGFESPDGRGCHQDITDLP
jgi:hypothetical protein